MRTLQRYILFDFLKIFTTALSVITLVLYLGAVLKGLDYVARGVPAGVLLKIFTLNVPYLLSFSIPMSTITATLLLFGRLSMDGEFTAMRAAGISTGQIIAPVLMAGLVLSLICLTIAYQVAPECRYGRRTALVNAEELDPIDLLDEGRFVSFPGLQIYVTYKNGNRLRDVEIYELDGHGDPRQRMRAERGIIETDHEAKVMQVLLEDVQILHPDPSDPADLSKAKIIPAKSYGFPVAYDEMLKTKNVPRKLKDMPFSMLMGCIHNVDDYFTFHKGQEMKREQMKVRAIVEAHKRFGMSVACFSFTLLGIPLGITSRRKESSSGIAVSLGVIFAFYLFVVIAESLSKKPTFYPDMIIWAALLICQIVGVILLKRIR